MQFYHYAKDLNGRSTGKPDKTCHDHLIDALRYSVMTIVQGYGKKPKQDEFIWEKYLEDEEYNFNLIWPRKSRGRRNDGKT